MPEQKKTSRRQPKAFAAKPKAQRILRRVTLEAEEERKALLSRRVELERKERFNAYKKELHALRKGKTKKGIRAGELDTALIQMLAEGDSWFDYPLDQGGIIDYLAVVHVMLIRFADMLKKVAKESKNVFYVPTQETLQPTSKWWANEIHPTSEGFEKIAEVFKTALQAQFPQLE